MSDVIDGGSGAIGDLGDPTTTRATADRGGR